MPPHVLIVGAGLGGLALAQSLKKNGASFEIFERDQSPTSRTQGWAIAIHTVINDLTGVVPEDCPPLASLSHLQPLDLPCQLCLYRDGVKAFVESNTQSPIIRVNRAKLREWLSNGIDIQWNKQVVDIAHSPTSVTVTFQDGTTAQGDVLIGADGANSNIRRALLSPGPSLTPLPCSTINGELTLSSSQVQTQLSLAHSAYVVAGPDFHLSVGLASLSLRKYYWYLNFYDPNQPSWTTTASKAAMHQYALEKCKAIPDQRLCEIVRLTKEEELLQPPILFRDLILEAIPSGKVTLIGDAAHAMAPFRGEGGCNAMQDGLTLGKMLAASTTEGIEDTLAVFHEEMLPRGRQAVSRARAALGQGDGEAVNMNVVWGQTLQVAPQST